MKLHSQNLGGAGVGGLKGAGVFLSRRSQRALRGQPRPAQTLQSHELGEPPKPGFGGCWVRPGQVPAELEAAFGPPQGGPPGIWFRGRRARPGVWR